MKLTIIYPKDDPKLDEDSYSQAYRDQFLSLCDRYENVQHVTESCSAEDLDGDVIIFYDIHSLHEIEIDGIKNHRALKYTYLDDPHQPGCFGRFRKTGVMLRKRGAYARLKREVDRGVRFIICPYRESYYKHFASYLGKQADKMLVWFPVSSDARRYKQKIPIVDRLHEVLANGSHHHLPQFKGYEFRKWAFKQDEIAYVPHCLYDDSMPRGLDYPKMLYDFAGALALCDTHVVPKYLEIPLAGCVCFAQYQEDYEKMGFRNGESCIYVDKENFSERINDFKNNVELYQEMADRGRKIAENWTSDKFADFIYNHAKEHLNGSG